MRVNNLNRAVEAGQNSPYEPGGGVLVTPIKGNGKGRGTDLLPGRTSCLSYQLLAYDTHS
jgi:hypothetical protein